MKTTNTQGEEKEDKADRIDSASDLTKIADILEHNRET